MVPAPTTAARAIARVGVSLGTSGILPASRSAKNRWRIAFDSIDRTQSANSSISRREPAVEVHGEARLDGVHRGERRASAARRPGERGANGLAGGDARGAIADLVLEIAGAAALPRRGTRAREGDGAVQQIAVDHGVDDARLPGPGGGDRLALGAHLERERRPAQARQPLRAAGARNDPEVHLGLAHVGGGDSHAVMTGHGELEAAAERMTVNGGNERLAGVFEPFQPRVHRLRSFEGLLARLQLLEDVDVRAGDERRARADQDDRVRGRIVAGALDGLADALGNAGAQGIHRWIVDGDDGNTVPHLVANQR